MRAEDDFTPAVFPPRPVGPVCRRSTYGWARQQLGHLPTVARALDLPMVRPILDEIDIRRACTFVILAPTQVFKSLVGQLRLLRSIQVEPRSSLWYAPTDPSVESFAKEKLNPLFDEAQTLRRLLYDDKNRRATQRIAFPSNTYLQMLSAGPSANRQSKTVCDIYLDEPWLYEPGWISEIQRRRESNPNDYREIMMTTGPTAGTQCATILQDTDVRRWHVRCPACQALFEPRFLHESESGEKLGGIRFERILRQDGMPDKDAIARSAVYECPGCHHRLPDTSASRTALSGTVDQPRGLFVATNLRPAPGHIGWQVNGCALKPWADIAIKFVFAQLARERAGDLQPMEDLVRYTFADIWDDKMFFARKSSRPIGEYAMGQDWPDELKDALGNPWRFCTIDVQTDCYYLVIRMWGRFSRSRLRLAARVMSVSDMKLLIEQHGVLSERVFIDARYEPQRVRRIAALNGWKTLMGDKQNSRGYRHEDGIFRIYDEGRIHDPLIGTPDQGKGQRVLEILFSKQAVLNRLHLLRTEESAILDSEGRPAEGLAERLWTSAADVPDGYWKQVEAHYRTKKTNPDGSEYWTWEGMKDDHFGDCEAEQVVAASIAGLTGAESMEAPSTEAKSTS